MPFCRKNSAERGIIAVVEHSLERRQQHNFCLQKWHL